MAEKNHIRVKLDELSTCARTMLSSPDGITPIHAMNDDYLVSGALLFPVVIFVPILSPDITILLSAPPTPWEERGHTWFL